jgi:putative addiction module component (TIGR02574 family)
MTPTVENLKQQLSLLSQDQRAELATFLLESLDPPDPSVEAAWQEELERRMEEMESGTFPGIPADEVFASMRSKFPRNR